MKVKITLSANAGVAIQAEGYRIWVDALHTEKQPGFSSVDPDLQSRMLECEAFKSPDVIAVTHCHPDHYSNLLIKRAQKLWPQALVLLPERGGEGTRLVNDDSDVFRKNELVLNFIRLPHEGEQYQDCIHYGLLICVKNKCILIPGDCAIASKALEMAVNGHTIDLALLNFPWLTLKRGQEFVWNQIKPMEILLYHLPFARDDTCGYRDAVSKALAKRRCGVVHVLQEPLQTIELDI